MEIKSQKRMFLYALLITFVMFNFGIYAGYKLESSRINQINDWVIESELELLNQRIQRDAFDVIGLNCDSLVEENIAFADRIFSEAVKIEKYENANRINGDIILLHKRYDLLRTLLWINSIKVKEECNPDYHNVVYLYQYNEPSLEQKAKQRFFSNVLTELKDKKGGEIILIPLAGDNDISVIGMILDKYEVSELPVILIDEKIKITEIESLDDIEKYLD